MVLKQRIRKLVTILWFENDVKTYGTQATLKNPEFKSSLRMM